MAVTAVNMTSHSVVFVQKLLSQGAVLGRPPNLVINPNIRLVVDALYQVLAGGTVSGTVPGTLTISPGTASIVSDLKAMEADCTMAINTVNDRMGYSYVIEF
jgi:hypothetical protein